jgi:hypothetical protein
LWEALNEKLPIINKTKHPKKRGRKRYKITNKGEPQGEHEQIKYLDPFPPTVARNISNIKRGGTTKRTFSLKNPSPTITTHLEIDVTCTHYNTTNTLCL